MNKHLLYQDAYMDSYYSPLPREKSNKEVLKYSSAKKYRNNKTVLDIPPSVTASYMQKNPFYFDLKKHSNRISGPRRPKSSTNKECSKSSTNFYRNKNKKNLNPNLNYFTIYEKSKLEEIFLHDKAKYIAPRKRLNEGCEKMQGLIYKPMNPRPQLTPAEVIKILNKIDFPEVPKNINIPNYINEFKIRQFIEKEYERLVEEEKGFPHGTFKLWEEDRVLILTNLFLIR